MSHFIVVVIGENWEGQLAPYSEQLEVDPYKDDEGEETTYNPKSRWDWYEMGGRWRGFFPMKPEGSGVVGGAGVFKNEAPPCTADQLKLGDVDFERAIREREAGARKRFGEWKSCWEKVGPSYKDTVSWKTMKESAQLRGEPVETARKAYHAQPLIEASNKNEKLRYMRDCCVEEFGFDEEKYVAECKEGILVPHAFVIGGHWIQQGRMGWWAIMSPETEAAEWSAFSKIIYSQIDKDTLVTAVDCHI